MGYAKKIIVVYNSNLFLRYCEFTLISLGFQLTHLLLASPRIGRSRIFLKIQKNSDTNGSIEYFDF